MRRFMKIKENYTCDLQNYLKGNFILLDIKSTLHISHLYWRHVIKTSKPILKCLFTMVNAKVQTKKKNDTYIRGQLGDIKLTIWSLIVFPSSSTVRIFYKNGNTTSIRTMNFFKGMNGKYSRRIKNQNLRSQHQWC